MIYCDRFEWGGKIYGHLISDTCHDELHAFARKLGLRRSWFQDRRSGWEHYDLTTERAIERAVAAGAKMISRRELVKMQPGYKRLSVVEKQNEAKYEIIGDK